MTRVKVDLVNDLFTIEPAPDDPQAVLDAVRALNSAYAPRVVSAEEAARIAKAAPPPPPMPPSVRAAIERARAEGKLVAFECFADG